MKTSVVRVVALTFFIAVSGILAPAVAQNWQLVWSDEFDGAEVDTTKWSFQVGDGCPDLCGWGNNELQYYQPENATVANGVLTITAQEDSVEGRGYTSARLRTIGKGDWTYGRFEARARMPVGRGMWPAFWMLSSDETYGQWAASGEIDIVEVLGHEPQKAYGTIHYGGESPANVFLGNEVSLEGTTFADDFHLFAVEWSPGIMHWYVDDLLYATITDWYSTGGPFPAPFDQDFHLLLNLAVGGNFPGNPDSTTVFPQEYQIDYVRVYQADNVPPVVSITSPSDGAMLRPGRTVSIAADATDADGSIFRVQFFQGDALLEEDSSPPYNIRLRSVANGCYTLRAEALDNLGGVAVSEDVSVQVGDPCVQAPYLMRLGVIPGDIEAENYDIGAAGPAYLDTDPDINQGNALGNTYRSEEGVDIVPTNDIGFGHHIGWLEAGEWLEYQVDVQSAGGYDVDLRVAADSLVNGLVHLELNGVDVTGPVAVGPTGGNDIWVTVRTTGVELPAGVATLRLVIERGGFNLNRISFSRSRPSTSAPNLFDGFEDGEASDWIGTLEVLSDRPAVGDYYVSTSWTGNGSGFYGGIYRNLENDIQAAIPEDPWLNVFVYHESAGTTIDRYRLEVTVREDTDGDGYTAGKDDSKRLDIWFDGDSFNDEWILVSAPEDSLLDLGTGSNGILEGNVDEVFIGIAQVEGPDPANVEVDFDHIILTSGGPFGGEATSVFNNGRDTVDRHRLLAESYPNPFHDRTVIAFELSQKARVQLDLYDVLGRHVRRIADGLESPGYQATRVDGSGIGPGVYFVRLRVDGELVGSTTIVKH